MATVIATKLSINKGSARVWCEGRKLSREGIEVGMKYELAFDPEAGQVRVTFGTDLPNPSGTVSRRKVRGTEEEYLPVLDMNDRQFLSLFQESEEIRIAIRDKRMVITAQVCSSDAKERVQRLQRKLANGEPLTVASLFHGGGVLDTALHAGLERAGVESYVKLAVELEGKYLESSLRNNPQLFRKDSVLFEGSVEHVNPRGASVEILAGGIPCTGASNSGRTKNKLAFAEEHESAGACFFHYLSLVIALNPAICIIENVVPYGSTASMAVIRSVLSSRGYVLEETVLDASEFGCLEKRQRLCVVARTPGAAVSDVLSNLVSTKVKESCVGDILEDIPDEDPRWREFSYLASKESRDLAAGKGFKRQLITCESTGYGTVGRSYQKCRSTEPFVTNSNNPDLSRLLTPLEHARGKGVPVNIIDGLPDTTAHEVLGQGVCFPPFEAVGFSLGSNMLAALSGGAGSQLSGPTHKAA
ncbi:DNA cytosine methyltransferase [Aeromonas sp. ARM81]|nr:DNA cytosine methyltransferase [Aeromonas sp. ARM81]